MYHAGIQNIEYLVIEEHMTPQKLKKLSNSTLIVAQNLETCE